MLVVSDIFGLKNNVPYLKHDVSHLQNFHPMKLFTVNSGRNVTLMLWPYGDMIMLG